jgi:hypothetical protein
MCTFWNMSWSNNCMRNQVRTVRGTRRTPLKKIKIKNATLRKLC